MRTKSPAFQFYAKDWLSSSKIALMPPQYEGAYIRLLAYCWDSGDCSLPDDDGQLAMLSRLGEGWLKGGSTVVRKCFTPHPTKPGFLSNERLLKEAEKQHGWSEKSSAGGRASAQKRAEKKQNSKGGSNLVEPNGNIASAFASAKKNPLPLPDWLPEDVWNDFKLMRRKMKAEMTDKAEQLAIADLTKLRQEGHDPRLVLEQSVMRGWKGLFALKSDVPRKTEPRREVRQFVKSL